MEFNNMESVINDLAIAIGDDVKKQSAKIRFLEFALSKAVFADAEVRDLADVKLQDIRDLGIEPEEVGTFNGLKKIMATLEDNNPALLQELIDDSINRIIENDRT